MNRYEHSRANTIKTPSEGDEYKSAAGGFPKTEFWRSFSALANTNDGTIVLGVKEKDQKFTPDDLSEELVTKTIRV